MPFTPDQVLFLDEDNTYGADELALPYRDIIGEGVVGAGDMLVSERAAGANMSVDVAAGACWITGDDDPVLQPTYRYREVATNLAIAAADPTNPRIDLVIAEVRDSTFAGVNKDARLRVITGTPAGAPTPPALPNNAIPLAEVSVPALDTTIENAQITDVRPRAKVGGGAAAGGGGGGGSLIPVNLLMPDGSGSAIFSPIQLTAWLATVWQFLPSQSAVVSGFARIPDDAEITQKKIFLDVAANATSGAHRLAVYATPVVDGESINFAAWQASSVGNFTVPGTAYLLDRIEFDLSATADWQPGDMLAVAVQRQGSDGGDTLAVNTLLIGAHLKVA